MMSPVAAQKLSRPMINRPRATAAQARIRQALYPPLQVSGAGLLQCVRLAGNPCLHPCCCGYCMLYVAAVLVIGTAHAVDRT
jgi:hypothetical protein